MKPNIKDYPRLKLQLMTIILSTALCLIGCSSSPRNLFPGNSFEGEITAKLAEELDDNSMKLKLDYNNMKYSIKANLFRLELSNKEGQVSPSGPTIMDLKSGVQRKINAEEKTYSELDMNKFKIPGSDETEAQNMPKITRTGKTETIAGYPCEYYQFGDQTDFCLAKGLAYIPTGNDYQGGPAYFFNQQGRHKPLITDPEFKKLVESGAFPLKITYEVNGQVKTYMEVTRIERKSLDDSLFQVPANYKKVEMPEFLMQR